MLKSRHRKTWNLITFGHSCNIILCATFNFRDFDNNTETYGHSSSKRVHDDNSTNETETTVIVKVQKIHESDGCPKAKDYDLTHAVLTPAFHVSFALMKTGAS